MSAHRAAARSWVSRHRNPRPDGGFTLVELLVVITILGILATVVVFAVSGLGDKGRSASVATEASILRTAEEAYCAQNGVYGTQQQLRSGGFLASDTGYQSVALTSSGACGGTGFLIGSPSTTSSSGPVILGASNTTGAFSFLLPSFISANAPVQLTFGASGTLAATANGGGGVLFASADEANVNATIATGDPVAGGAAGTCAAATCRGIGSTKVQYTTGQLVVFSCRSGSTTLPPASGATAACPVSSRLSTALTTCGRPAPSTAADVVALLTCDATLKLTIANPGNTLTSPATAPYGLAAYQALTSSGTGGGGLTPAQFTALQTAGRITYGTNVTATQTNVETGAADIAMLPRSFVVSPGGNDTNNWTTIAPALHETIAQWAVVLGNGSAADQALGQKFLDYVRSATGQSVLASFGYGTS